ncbi:hypothetical protein [Asticcacaulis sp. 201]|uniref:hypothetical protein n=1 Tax=Asticcacaulis sp. 201 TaxID=3028787 RepID=UPI002916A619|nr:hypothetical protein [Asticcacaulis sp. 201]MDV6331784.1 hypothetical protein [Asticcacaulis sp. 201]
MSISFQTLIAGVIAAAMIATGIPVAQAAGVPLTPEQSKKVAAYLAQSPAMPARTPTNVQTAIANGVMLAMTQAEPAPVTASAVPTVTPAPSLAVAGSEPPSSTASRSRGMLAILNVGAPESTPAEITYGLAAGQGVAPSVPVTDAFVHDTAIAVVAAFQKSDRKTADAVATYAATPALDPAVEERVALAQAVYKIDGTDALIRHFVAVTHMRLIIQEVARHIDFSKMSETDKYRLAAIAAVAQTELEDKIIRMNALIQAQNLTKADLLQLLAAYDTDAQRKLTNMRLHDDGKVDSAAELDIRLAQYQIIKAYESTR